MVEISGAAVPQARRLHAILNAALALLAVILLVAMAFLVFEDWRRHRFTNDVGDINQAAGLLLNCASQWAIERGVTHAALHDPGPASDRILDQLARQRSKADAAYLEAVALMEREEIFRGPEAARSEFQAEYEEIRDLRERVDAALALPSAERPPELRAEWFPQMTRLITQARQISLASSHLFSGNELLFNLMSVRDSASAMSEYAGRGRAILGGLIAGGAQADERTHRLLLNYQGRVQAYWELIVLFASDPQAPSDLRAAVARAEENFFGHFEEIHAEIHEAMVAGAPYPLSGEAWLSHATTAINHLLEIERAAGEAATRHARELSSASAVRMGVNTGLMMIPALIALGIAVFFFYQVIQPLQVIGRTMLHLSRGGCDLEIPFTKRRDEIGVMAQAIAAFKQSVTEKLRLEEEVERRRQVEAELRRATVEAEKANRAKSEFLANMSHELRTPLNAINGFSELLALGYAGDLTERQHDYLRDINDAGIHLLALIDDVLDLSKVESGKLKCKQELLSLPDLIAQSVRMVRERAQAGGLNLKVEAADDLPPILGDERMVRQMLTNLLTNAVKFTPEGGEIILRAGARDGNGVFVEVADTGIGMTSEDIPKALSLFGQVHPTMNGKEEGTGLGLPLVKRLIELHGGRLDLESEPGVGTRVRLEFPLEDGADEASAEALSQAALPLA